MHISRTAVLLLCTVVVTMTSIGMSSFSLFLRPMETDFGWSRSMVTLPYMFAMLGWGAGAVLFGKLADDYGSRRVILGGILLMAAGFLGMSLSANVWQLSLTYGAMVGMAMGACGLAIASLLVSQHYDTKSRGLAVSVLQTSAVEPAALCVTALLDNQPVWLARRCAGNGHPARDGGAAAGLARRARPKSGRRFSPPSRRLGGVSSLPA